MRRSILVVAVGLGVVAASAASGCSKDDAAKPMPPAAPIASSVTVGSKGIDFAIDPTSKTSIDMPAPKERIKATTTAAKGTVHFDPSDLTMTRGDVLIDLSTLTTSTFGDADKDATQTKHAHTWLQIDDMEKDPAVRERNRWVHFAIRSVDGLSATDLAKVAPATVGGDDVRTVTLVAHGDARGEVPRTRGLAARHEADEARDREQAAAHDPARRSRHQAARHRGHPRAEGVRSAWHQGSQ